MTTLDFKTVKKYTDDGRYVVDFDLEGLPEAIQRYVNKYGLQMNPDFQRGHVWTQAQQTAFVEYVLKGGQLQPIRFNHTDWNGNKSAGEMVCVDGLQRITALLKFANNELPVFDGHTLSQLTNFNLWDYYVKISINGLKTRAEVLNWYIELNSGGTVHTDEEIIRVKALLAKEVNNG